MYPPCVHHCLGVFGRCKSIKTKHSKRWLAGTRLRPTYTTPNTSRLSMFALLYQEKIRYVNPCVYVPTLRAPLFGCVRALQKHQDKTLEALAGGDTVATNLHNTKYIKTQHVCPFVPRKNSIRKSMRICTHLACTTVWVCSGVAKASGQNTRSAGWRGHGCDQLTQHQIHQDSARLPFCTKKKFDT